MCVAHRNCSALLMGVMMVQEARHHVEQLAPAVKLLAQLETQAQLSFFNLKRKWGHTSGLQMHSDVEMKL